MKIKKRTNQLDRARLSKHHSLYLVSISPRLHGGEQEEASLITRSLKEISEFLDEARESDFVYEVRLHRVLTKSKVASKNRIKIEANPMIALNKD